FVAVSVEFEFSNEESLFLSGVGLRIESTDNDGPIVDVATQFRIVGIHPDRATANSVADSLVTPSAADPLPGLTQQREWIFSNGDFVSRQTLPSPFLAIAVIECDPTILSGQALCDCLRDQAEQSCLLDHLSRSVLCLTTAPLGFLTGCGVGAGVCALPIVTIPLTPKCCIIGGIIGSLPSLGCAASSGFSYLNCMQAAAYAWSNCQ
ncbi:MAG: hypothetical protein AAF747_09520, partial [Planctomycetota bacterium]